MQRKSIRIFVSIPILILVMIGVVSLLYPQYTIEGFLVKTIEVQGNQHISTEDIIILSEVKEDIPLWQVAARSVEDRIKTHIFVEDALVIRKFPSTISITIKEREPRIMIPSEGRFVVLDYEGIAIEIIRSMPEEVLPFYSGRNVQIPILIGQKVVQREVQEVLTFYETIPEQYRYLIHEIEPLKNTWNIYSVDGIRIGLGTSERMDEKIEFLDHLYRDTPIFDEHQDIRYIDLSDPSNPVIKYE